MPGDGVIIVGKLVYFAQGYGSRNIWRTPPNLPSQILGLIKVKSRNRIFTTNLILSITFLKLKTNPFEICSQLLHSLLCLTKLLSFCFLSSFCYRIASLDQQPSFFELDSNRSTRRHQYLDTFPVDSITRYSRTTYYFDPLSQSLFCRTSVPTRARPWLADSEARQATGLCQV